MPTIQGFKEEFHGLGQKEQIKYKSWAVKKLTREAWADSSQKKSKLIKYILMAEIQAHGRGN